MSKLLLLVFLSSVLLFGASVATADVLDPNDLPPYGQEAPLYGGKATAPTSQTDVDNLDGTWTFTQVVDEASTPPNYLGPWASQGGWGWNNYGFEYYSWYNQDYGWLHTFPHWNIAGLNILSATLTIHAWDVDAETSHGYEGEYDGLHIDGVLLSPGYLQGTNNTWSTTIFNVPLSSITDDGNINSFLDIDMHHTDWFWATTVNYSSLEITYTTGTTNNPPYQPVLDYTLTLIDDCHGGGPCTENGQDLVITVVGPAPPDPDGDAVTYTYRWFVDEGTGGFVDDEFAGRGDHTGNTVPAVDILPEDIWQVQVMPVDEHGAVGTYATITFPQFCPDQTTCNDPPVAICQNVTVNADANCEANASVDNGSYDPDGDPITIIPTPAPPYPLGATTVTLIVTDDGGLADTCVGIVTVVDNTAPVVTCPGNITVGSEQGQCGAVVNFTATVTDNCGATVACTPPTGSFFTVGVNPVTCIGTDGSGNADTCTFTVTVNDVEPPVANCPGNITVDNDPDVCGAVVNFTATATDNCPGVMISCTPPSGSLFPVGVTTVTCIAVDAVQLADTCTFTITVNDVEPPVATCPGDITVNNDPGVCGAVVNFAATATDNCPGVTIGCVPPSGSFFPVGLTTVTCIAVDAVQLADTCSFTVTVNDNEPPALTCPPNQTHHWSTGPQNVTATAVDNCPGPMAFSIVSVIPPMFNPVTMNTVTGVITYDPDCEDLPGSPHVITVQVLDANSNASTCNFSITVTNDLPTITCPADVALWYSYMGDMGPLAFTASDGTDPIIVTIASAKLDGVETAPIGPMWLDGFNFHFDPVWLDEGDWVITLMVDDGCEQVTCEFNIHVVGKFFLCMDSTSVLSGYNATITLSVTNSMATGGFDFLITYDPTIQFLEAEAVGMLLDWEYFTYRKSYMDNCGGGCPTGVLRLIGMANLPDGLDPGDVYHLDGPIVEMTFTTPENLSYINQCFHLSWTWYDCGDNTMSSRSGDTLFMAQNIAEILPDKGCLDGDKVYTPDPRINFCDGIICIIPPPDDRGDINLNGVPNEIADAVLLSNYFIVGPEVLGYPDDPYYPNRVLASDINDDGIPHTIADLVYLIRIITGDAIPYGESGEGKVATFANAAAVGYEIDQDLVVTSHSTVSVGGAAFIFRHTGEIGAPVLTDEVSGMTLRSSDLNGELRVLVYSMDANSITAGSHDLFTVPLNDNTIELVEVQLSDAEGNLLAVNTNKIAPPTAFELMQNYPNPFNAGTSIRFALPIASDWSLRVYNIAGQLVKEFKGHNEAGLVNLHWDAANSASGIYFYKLSAGDFTDTRKMTLIK